MITQLILSNEEGTLIAAIKTIIITDTTVTPERTIPDTTIIPRIREALQEHYDTEEEIIIDDTQQPNQYGIYKMTITIPRSEDEGGEYTETITVTPVPEY